MTREYCLLHTVRLHTGWVEIFLGPCKLQPLLWDGSCFGEVGACLCDWGVEAGANRGMFEGFTSMITRSHLSVNTCGGRTHTYTHTHTLSFFLSPGVWGKKERERECVCVCVRPPQVFTDRRDRVIIEVKPSNMPRFAPAATPPHSLSLSLSFSLSLSVSVSVSLSLSLSLSLTNIQTDRRIQNQKRRQHGACDELY